MKITLITVLILLNLSCGRSGSKTAQEEWIPLFNGKDLNDWEIKIKGYALNDNYKNIFSVEDGIMKVRYEGVDTFNNQFGHIFYKEPFSHYKLRIEYRFVGDQVPGRTFVGIQEQRCDASFTVGGIHDARPGFPCFD